MKVGQAFSIFEAGLPEEIALPFRASLTLPARAWNPPRLRRWWPKHAAPLVKERFRYAGVAARSPSRASGGYRHSARQPHPAAGPPAAVSRRVNGDGRLPGSALPTRSRRAVPRRSRTVGAPASPATGSRPRPSKVPHPWEQCSAVPAPATPPGAPRKTASGNCGLLAELFMAACADRNRHRAERWIRAAGFPRSKRLNDLRHNPQPAEPIPERNPSPSRVELAQPPLRSQPKRLQSWRSNSSPRPKVNSTFGTARPFTRSHLLCILASYRGHAPSWWLRPGRLWTAVR